MPKTHKKRHRVKKTNPKAGYLGPASTRAL